MKRRSETAITAISIDLLIEYRLIVLDKCCVQIIGHYLKLEPIDTGPQLYHLCVYRRPECSGYYNHNG